MMFNFDGILISGSYAQDFYCRQLTTTDERFQRSFIPISESNLRKNETFWQEILQKLSFMESIPLPVSMKRKRGVYESGEPSTFEGVKKKVEAIWKRLKPCAQRSRRLLEILTAEKPLHHIMEANAYRILFEEKNVEAWKVDILRTVISKFDDEEVVELSKSIITFVKTLLHRCNYDAVEGSINNVAKLCANKWRAIFGALSFLNTLKSPEMSWKVIDLYLSIFGAQWSSLKIHYYTPWLSREIEKGVMQDQIKALSNLPLRKKDFICKLCVISGLSLEEVYPQFGGIESESFFLNGEFLLKHLPKGPMDQAFIKNMKYFLENFLERRFTTVMSWFPLLNETSKLAFFSHISDLRSFNLAYTFMISENHDIPLYIEVIKGACGEIFVRIFQNKIFKNRQLRDQVLQTFPPNCGHYSTLYFSSSFELISNTLCIKVLPSILYSYPDQIFEQVLRNALEKVKRIQIKHFDNKAFGKGVNQHFITKLVQGLVNNSKKVRFEKRSDGTIFPIPQSGRVSDEEEKVYYNLGKFLISIRNWGYYPGVNFSNALFHVIRSIESRLLDSEKGVNAYDDVLEKLDHPEFVQLLEGFLDLGNGAINNLFSNVKCVLLDEDDIETCYGKAVAVLKQRCEDVEEIELDDLDEGMMEKIKENLRTLLHTMYRQHFAIIFNIAKGMNKMIIKAELSSTSDNAVINMLVDGDLDDSNELIMNMFTQFFLPHQIDPPIEESLMMGRTTPFSSWQEVCETSTEELSLYFQGSLTKEGLKNSIIFEIGKIKEGDAIDGPMKEAQFKEWLFQWIDNQPDDMEILGNFVYSITSARVITPIKMKLLTEIIDVSIATCDATVTIPIDFTEEMFVAELNALGKGLDTFNTM